MRRAAEIERNPSAGSHPLCRVTLSGKADYLLYTSAKEALFRRGASSSRIAQLNIVDILYTAYVNRNYEEVLNRLNKTYMDKERKGGNEHGTE